MRLLDTCTNKFTQLKSRLPQLLKMKELRAENSDIITSNVPRGSPPSLSLVAVILIPSPHVDVFNLLRQLFLTLKNVVWGVNQLKLPVPAAPAPPTPPNGPAPPAPAPRKVISLEEALLFRKLYRDVLVCISHIQSEALPPPLRPVEKVSLLIFSVMNRVSHPSLLPGNLRRFYANHVPD